MRSSCSHEPPAGGGVERPRTGLATPSRSLKSRVVAALSWLLARGAVFVDRRVVSWHRLPARAGLFILLGIRNRMRETNLAHPVALSPATGGTCAPAAVARSADGSSNDEVYPTMGSAGTAFGRNVPLARARVDRQRLLVPNPRRISNELLARGGDFKAAEQLNLLAAAWIQFMVHDWFSHGRNPHADPIEVPIEDPNDPWHERPMRVRRTLPGPPEPPEHPQVFLNTETHWWDASQLYGSSDDRQTQLRTGTHGKLKLDGRDLLPLDESALGSGDLLRGAELTGLNDNWWIGLSLLHTIFVREHNAICDRLRGRYPNWCDDALFNHARLVNAALLAKIHTLEWTPAILGHPALQIGMRGNWWGLAGETVHRLLGRITDGEVLSGIPGSPMDHHGVPYAITEEFVTVYRMHPLMPDSFTFRSARGDPSSPPLFDRDLTLYEVSGRATRAILSKADLADVAYSFGRMHPGKITLKNYPETLRNIEKDGIQIDLATVDILRDRERGVPRYNEFRELVHRPRISSFRQLNEEYAKKLAGIYGNVNDVDAMVGLFAEKPPRNFGFSDTAFRIFILMASRRLKSDRFFTADYRPEVYTPEGMEWIENNDLRSVLLRHFAGRGFDRLEQAIAQSQNAFFPWT